MRKPIPCPKCGAAVPVPDFPAGSLTCPKCQAKLKVGMNKSAGPSGTRPATPVDAGSKESGSDGGSGARRGMSFGMLSAIVGGAVLVVAVIAVAAMIMNADPGKNTPGGEVGKGPGKGKTDKDKDDVPRINIPGSVQEDGRDQAVLSAVDKGVLFLKKELKDAKFNPSVDLRPGWTVDELRAGVAALIGLTLLETGAAPEDEAIMQVTQIIREQAKTMKQIYVLSASLFFFNRLNEAKKLPPEKIPPEDVKLARTFVLRIISGQTAEGMWFYSGFVLTPGQEEKLAKDLQEHRHRPTLGGPMTVSNAQFAMLALWGSRHYGVEVRDTLLLAAAYFHNNQKKDGHWIYYSGEDHHLWTTSTAAGLICLAIEKVLLEDKEFAKHPRPVQQQKTRADVELGFEYVAKSIGRKKGDPGILPNLRGTIFEADAWGDLYYLWTMERLGVIYGRDKFGKDQRDWYEWGRRVLLSNQRPNGSWKDRHGELVDTCFALLFLKRANIAKDLTDKLKLLMSSIGPVLEPALPRREQPVRV